MGVVSTVGVSSVGLGDVVSTVGVSTVGVGGGVSVNGCEPAQDDSPAPSAARNPGPPKDWGSSRREYAGFHDDARRHGNYNSTIIRAQMWWQTTAAGPRNREETDDAQVHYRKRNTRSRQLDA